jgi:hypothetical protein
VGDLFEFGEGLSWWGIEGIQRGSLDSEYGIERIFMNYDCDD